jgi:predicted PurR-regulated permease PerM
VVLRPFIISLILAAVLAHASWPVYGWLLSRLHGRSGAAAMAMTALLLLTFVTPFAIMGVSLVDNAVELLKMLRETLNQPLPPPPGWLEVVPLAGDYLRGKWILLMQGDEGAALLQIKQYLLERLAGHRAKQLIEVTAGTVSRVVNGILGTALAQSVLALIGFWIAGVPGAMLLGLLTFFLSIIPMGPPLVWLPAALWLYSQGEISRAIFLALYGVVVVSSIDNVIKPYLISRGGSLPLLLVFMGVLGGLLAFGFIGVFLGPVILAVAYALLSEWMRPAAQAENSSETPAG